MNLIKKLCLFLATLMLIASVSACGQTADVSSGSSNLSTSSDVQSGTSSTITSSDLTSSDINSVISSDTQLPVGSETEKTDNDFSNTDPNYNAPKPDSQMTDAEKEASGLYDKVWVPDVEGDTQVGDQADPNVSEGYNYADSLFAEIDLFQYVYENDWYAYGITEEGSEVIAYKDAEGKYFDVLSGGGSYVIRNTRSQNLATAAKVKSFERLTLRNYNALFVRYEISGLESGTANIETTYIFYERTISVSARVSVSTDSVISRSGSIFSRDFINGFVSCTRKMNTEWDYPEDGDYPIKALDSWVTKNVIDDIHTVYTFNRGNISQVISGFYTNYPATNIPLTFAQGNSIDHTITYDLVLARSEKGEEASDYVALFDGDHSDFAAGIAPVTPNTENNTIYVGDKVELNLNVTNIADYDLEFSARYDIRDYYGNIVDAGIFLNSTAFEGMEANRVVTVSADEHGYGMYYLNFMVVSKYYTYREFYTFALLDDYEYKYNETSPFGIVQFIRNENVITYENIYDLISKIGVAATRNIFTIFSTDEYINKSMEYQEKLKQDGIRHYAQDAGASGSGALARKLELLQAYCDDYTYGNELNLRTINGNSTIEAAMDNYQINYFNIAEELTDKYGKNHFIAGVSAGQTKWYDELVKRGMWDKMEGISLHSYGIPYTPDNPSYLNVTWSAEGGIIRTIEAFKKYGVKRFILDETGYHSRPIRTQCSIRLQADLNIRCLILGAYYGAEYVGLYGAQDYSNSGIGINNNDSEYHFGQFYFKDYFDRILVKPAAITFAFCTRQLESLKSITESTKYSNGTVRAFVADTEVYGKVVVCWSRKYSLYVDEGQPRVPKMPWQTVWDQGTDDTVFEAEGDKVIVTDSNGRDTVYYPDANGNVTIPLTGEVFYIKGVKA